MSTVAAEGDVKRPKRLVDIAQIVGLETRHLPQLRFQFPEKSLAREIFDKHGNGQAAIDFELGILRAARLVENMLCQISADDGDVPVLQAHFGKQHRQAIGFLAGGSGPQTTRTTFVNRDFWQSIPGGWCF